MTDAPRSTPDWIAEFSGYAHERHREQTVERVARFIYPRPIWAGGMSDMPQPKTARGYAQAIVDMIG